MGAVILGFPERRGGGEFWDELAAILDRAADMDLTEAELVIAEFLDQYRGDWINIQRDMRANPARQEMLERALGLRGK